MNFSWASIKNSVDSVFEATEDLSRMSLFKPFTSSRANQRGEPAASYNVESRVLTSSLSALVITAVFQQPGSEDAFHICLPFFRTEYLRNQ